MKCFLKEHFIAIIDYSKHEFSSWMWGLSHAVIQYPLHITLLYSKINNTLLFLFSKMGSQRQYGSVKAHELSRGFNSSIMWLLKNTADSISERWFYRVNGKWTQFQRQNNMYLSLDRKKGPSNCSFWWKSISKAHIMTANKGWKHIKHK